MFHLIFKLILIYLVWLFISGVIRTLRSSKQKNREDLDQQRRNAEANRSSQGPGGKVFETDYRVVKKSDMTDTD